jgi:hypothetical protein
MYFKLFRVEQRLNCWFNHQKHKDKETLLTFFFFGKTKRHVGEQKEMIILQQGLCLYEVALGRNLWWAVKYSKSRLFHILAWILEGKSKIHGIYIFCNFELLRIFLAFSRKWLEFQSVWNDFTSTNSWFFLFALIGIHILWFSIIMVFSDLQNSFKKATSSNVNRLRSDRLWINYMRWWRGSTLNLSWLILILAYHRRNCTIIWCVVLNGLTATLMWSGSVFFFLRHHHPANVPEFSFVSVVKDEVCNAVMSIKSNAAGMDVIPLRFIDLLLPVLLGTLNNVFNHIFFCSEFPPRWEGLCGAANSKGCCPRKILGL